jgi:hypothetical protein
VLQERMLSLKTGQLLFALGILIILILALRPLLAPSFSKSANQNIWNIHDVIEPSLDKVKWSEEGVTSVAPSWISNGAWIAVSVQQSLVAPGDIFVLWWEYFNWAPVSNMFGLTFASSSDFAANLTATPLWWLKDIWGINTDWDGISTNTTEATVAFNDTTVALSMWFHLTRIPEYFAGQGGFQSFLAGFDLTPVSIGELTAWEFHEDWSQVGILYNIYFEAPSHLLSQQEGNYTFSIDVSTNYQSRTFNTSQIIDVDMPATTEIKRTSPSTMTTVENGNIASFHKGPEDTYPAAFTVVSGPPSKSLGQTIADDASLWFSTPGGWAAIGSLLVLSFTGLRGRKIWNRNKLYNRLYKSMVSIYNMYSKDLLKFHQEMDSISRTIIKVLVEDKINDEQFEKLLKRRDDLMLRVQ